MVLNGIKVSRDEAALSSMAAISLFAQSVAIQAILDAIRDGQFDEEYQKELAEMVDRFRYRAMSLLKEIGYTHEEAVLLIAGAKQRTITIMAEMLMNDLMKEMEDEAK